MTDASPDHLTVFPPFNASDRGSGKHDSVFDLTLDPSNPDQATMAGSPFIKSEPNEFGQFDPNTFMPYNNSGHQQNQYQSNGSMNINPANLSNGMSQSFTQPNMSSSFNMGNSGIADDELLDLELNHGQPSNNGMDFGQGMQQYFQQSANQQAAYSHTPDNAMQSPFTNPGGNNMAGLRQFGGHSMPQQGYRPHMQHLDRKVSDSRSPATPNTPGMNHMQLGEDFSHPGMQQIHHQRQQKSLGGAGWDSTPNSHSWNDASPFPSPNGQPVHNQISEVLKTNSGSSSSHHPKVASSLPTKMEGGAPAPALQSQEAKRRRRRESHNLVERRRRDNINERIQDLGGLVPQHRLEDEKVRKHLQTNAPLSPSIANATGMSPPAATSLLAGASARRATGSGNITQGLPIEEKDKGPNKGDILNGSVAWTRDLMWYTHKKLQQEQELKEYITGLGGRWPFEQTDDDRRMHSEICEILNKHAPQGGFTGYSRGPGSGMRVPGFTNVAGESVNGGENHPANGFPNHSQQQQQAISPGFQSGGSGMSSGQMSHQQQHFWGGEFKEEDEYGMEMQ